MMFEYKAAIEQNFWVISLDSVSQLQFKINGDEAGRDTEFCNFGPPPFADQTHAIREPSHILLNFAQTSQTVKFAACFCLHSFLAVSGSPPKSCLVCLFCVS